MDSEIVKGKPLTKEETKFLLELVEGSKIITTKTTNATNNKLKTEEWIRLTEIFNATATKSRRTWQQLRLKWENLKKNARKRSTKIRMNQIKTGGGPPEYIPPDDILDRVTSLLGSTVGGFTVPFGGDRESTCFVVGGGGGGDGGGGGGGGEGGSSGDGFGDARVSLVNENPIISIPMSTDNNIEVDNGIENMVTNYNVLDVVDQNVMTGVITFWSTTSINTKRFTFSTPRAVKKKLKPDESRIARNNAIAEYFNTKKQCLDAKINKIHLENDNLQLKNLQLSLENEKLVVETEKLKLELQNLKESL